jgi:hypothetical protein
MQQPKGDRTMQSVLIWNAGTFIGEQQALWIVDAVGSPCSVCVCGGNVEKFRAEYSNPAYDVIWVTTHGNF